MELIVLNPKSANQDLLCNLIAVSISSRNMILKQQMWSFLFSIYEVIHLTDSFHPPKKDEEIHSFHVPAHFAFKVPHFVLFFRALSTW